MPGMGAEAAKRLDAVFGGSYAKLTPNKVVPITKNARHLVA